MVKYKNWLFAILVISFGAVKCFDINIGKYVKCIVILKGMWIWWIYSNNPFRRLNKLKSSSVEKKILISQHIEVKRDMRTSRIKFGYVKLCQKEKLMNCVRKNSPRKYLQETRECTHECLALLPFSDPFTPWEWYKAEWMKIPFGNAWISSRRIDYGLRT